jgi:choline dehydrogenase-like flavoprotein/phosphodiesterase/alkaline phosphatase D-like protein/pimeloyl-ACP methyl ester carboxylesterase
METEKHGSDNGDDRPHVARWLSEGFEDLLCKLDSPAYKRLDAYDFDIVIVGSGYGGAIAAAQLAGYPKPGTDQAVRLCVLERGREYLSGMFPVSEAELPGHVRISTANKPGIRGNADALMDLRVGPDVCALVANGLGGGSLINAGVLARPTDDVLSSKAWPRDLRKQNALERYYDEAERILAPTKDNKLSRFDKSGDDGLPLKFKALRTLGGEAFGPAPLSIAIDGGENSAGIELQKCKRCGDCATGCNHGAKNSLDHNCLVRARRKGAEIYCGATVLKLERLPANPAIREVLPDFEAAPAFDDGWMLHVVHTDPDLRRRRGRPLRLRARRVILAAGTFGSTEILLRSQSRTLRFSSCLGQRFSTNGDLLAVAYDQKDKVNAVVRESVPFDKRDIGPTITGMIDRRTAAEGIAIQEFAIPGALRRLFAESFTLAHTFYQLGQKGRSHRHGSGGAEPCGVNSAAIEKTQVFGLMGDDGAAGTLGLVPGCSDDSPDGAIQVHWSSLRSSDGSTIFDKQVTALRELVEATKQGGKVLPNPIWRLLPGELESIVDIPRGPALTVHPLGGCSMADESRYGVVNQFGQVFDPDAPGVHDGLAVLDGSVIPCALGINPSLTIAAVTLRALDELCKTWVSDGERVADQQIKPFPRLRPVKVPASEPTVIRILERMKGEMALEFFNGHAEKRVVELTLAFHDKRLDELSTSLTRRLEVDETKSRVRVFEPSCYDELWRTGASETRFDRSAKFIAPITGHMMLLDRAQSWVYVRALRALGAWFLNRGTRDLWERWISERRKTNASGSHKSAVRPRDQFRLALAQVLAPLCKARKGLKHFFYFAGHAGESRLFEYELEIGEPRRGDEPAAIAIKPEQYCAPMAGRVIRGRKQLTYSIAGNPWRQLTELKITDFPNMLPCSEKVLELEPKYYARQEKHLLEIAGQRDHATALFELTSFLLCMMRILLTTHIWSFRKPDKPRLDRPQRLPGKLPGLPEPQVNDIEVGTARRRARIRLTRYARLDAEDNPVLLIHGFSANGTTFAHPALRPSLASYLWERRKDVWILDLRTSSGLDTSKERWRFEDVAVGDIPAAFTFIQGATQKKQIDVVTQCMGAAMLSMSILDSDVRCLEPNDPDRLRVQGQRPDFLESVGSVVLSQIAPLIVFSPANIYRAYVVSYVQHALSDRTFELRPDEGLTSHLLDRLLASVPYPKNEFRIENPLIPWRRTPWVGTRHRMDAWFGRVLNVGNMEPEVLEHIDDMFGTINLHTTFQTIHFARSGMITTHRGRNAFVTPKSLRDWKKIPTLSIHGSVNGLADVATVTRMHALMRSIGGKYHSLIVEGLGHQDCMIGRDAGKKIFPEIFKFLSAPRHYKSPSPTPTSVMHGGVEQKGPVVEVPWLGPMLSEREQDEWRIAVAPNPKFAQPAAVVVVPVTRKNGRWRMQGDLRDEHFTPAPQPISCGVAFADEQRWYEAKIQANHWDATESLLVLLMYDLAPVVGKLPYFDQEAQEPTLEFKKPKVKKAIDDYLEDASSEELEPGLVTRPREAEKDAPLRFAAGSCQYPPGPLDPTLAGRSYQRLHGLLDEPNSPQFLVLCGDQVYVDATVGLMDPSTEDDRYELPYETLLRAPSVRRVLKRLPAYTMLDDHEIDNNWEPLAPSTEQPDQKQDRSKEARVDAGRDLDKRRKAQMESEEKLDKGKKAYMKYQRAVNHSDASVVWYSKSLRGFPFFFADTRTERTARSAVDIDNARIMGEAQFKELTNWLSAHKDHGTPVFIVTPSILLPRQLLTTCTKASALRSDAWDGYPGSLNRLLAHIASEQIHNVVFLSGDEHHSCIAKATLTRVHAGQSVAMGKPVVIQSIHSSGLYTPYVFANGRPETLAGKETFSFEEPDGSGKYDIRCEVETEFVEGVGGSFAVVECTRAAGDRWSLQCNFHFHAGIKSPATRDIYVAGSGRGETHAA